MQVLVTALGVRSGCLARGTRASLRPRFRAPASQGAETMQGLRPGQGRCDPTLRWHLDWTPETKNLRYNTNQCQVLATLTTRHEKQRGCALACTRTACLQGKGKKKFIRPTILLRVGVLWAVAGWLSPRSSLEAFPQPTRQVVARARTPWELSGLGNARGPGEWNGHHLLFLRTPPSLSTTACS